MKEVSVKERIDEAERLSSEGLSIKEIAAQMGISERTINSYLVARRQGFPTVTEYLDYLAQKKGFESRRDYLRSKTPTMLRGQEAFEASFERPGNVQAVIRTQEYQEKELAEMVCQLVQGLPGRYRFVIEERFFSDNLLENLGAQTFNAQKKTIGISREATRKLEERALKRLYHAAIRAGLRDYLY